MYLICYLNSTEKNLHNKSKVKLKIQCFRRQHQVCPSQNRANESELFPGCTCRVFPWNLITTGEGGEWPGQRVFHPKDQVEEQDGNLQVKSLMRAHWGSRDSAHPWNPHVKLTKGGSDKSDVSFHPISLLWACKQKLGKRNYFIRGDQKLSLPSSQTKFGVMWVTQWKLVMQPVSLMWFCLS